MEIRTYRNERGFSLIEILIAVMLLAVISTAIIGMFVFAAEQVAEARKMETATRLASEAIETKKNLSSHRLCTQPLWKVETLTEQENGQFTVDYTCEEGDGCDATPEYNAYKRVVGVLTDTVNGNPVDGLHTIHAAVLYERPGGTESTTTGEVFDPENPGSNRPSVLLTTVVKTIRSCS